MKKTTTTKKTTNKAVKGVKKAVKPTVKPTGKKTAVKTASKPVKAKEAVKKPVKKTIDEYEIRKDFLKAYGYETVSEFSQAIGDDIANTTKVLQGKQKPNIEKMIKYAVFLNAGLGDIINLFYPEQMEYYKKNHNKKR